MEMDDPVKRVMAAKGKQHFNQAKTFQGKVDMLEGKPGFGKGMDSAHRDRMARGIVAKYVQKHG